jgi:hypothetical protein
LPAGLPGADHWLWRDGSGGCLSEAMVRFAARHEMAREVEDVLARRSRLLFLDAAEAGASGRRRGRDPGRGTGAGPSTGPAVQGAGRAVRTLP